MHICARIGKHFKTNEWTSSKTQSHTQEVTSIAWHPQSDTLATVGYDKAVKVWDIRNKKLAADYSTRSETAHSLGDECADIHLQHPTLLSNGSQTIVRCCSMPIVAPTRQP